MREYKYRGQSCETHEWIYGSLLKDISGTYWIISCEDKNPLPYVNWVRVIKETVGEYTGLHDKTGKEICEGDIIKVFGNITNPRTKEQIPYNTIARVKFGENTGCFLYHVVGSCVSSNFRYTKADGLNYEVIGNVTDNPELLDGEAGKGK